MTIISSRYCRVCAEPDNLTDGLCPTCQRHEANRAFIEQLASLPISTPSEALKWLRWVKERAIELTKERE